MAGSEHTLSELPYLEGLDESARKSLKQRARWVRTTGSIPKSCARRAGMDEVDDAGNTARISSIPVHADIAARISTTCETVARVLSELAKQGLVKREKDALMVLDLERLEGMVKEVRDL
ncbi:MAG: hypothetical protein CL566_01910 [Alphaproteobacteria bacterium]|nr:hypothetical protein [Alphaproteobacteria bacterium]|tara:strand:+ start:2575 stop:2931 length:357 start_codon:yes stop_codon:yes gene_type:complete